MNVIDSFRGKHRFLSNFLVHAVHLDGAAYLSVEHAFQAAKTLDHTKRKPFQELMTCSEAKHLGRRLPLRADWESVKDRVMLALLREKFAGSLKDDLLATGKAKLIEGNTWGDTYWGVCRGEGMNMLGLLLMQVRHELSDGLDL